MKIKLNHYRCFNKEEMHFAKQKHNILYRNDNRILIIIINRLFYLTIRQDTAE
jgi:hypothetical protein